MAAPAPIPHQFVLRQADQLVLRCGYCDFTVDGSFNPGTEEILVLEWATKPNLLLGEQWYWNGVDFDIGGD